MGSGRLGPLPPRRPDRLSRRRIAAKEKTLNAFNFRGEDQRTIADVVDQLDDRIVALNDEFYQLRQLSKRIDESLEQRKITFDPDAAGKLFAEAGVVFDGQLKKDYKQLIEFNRAITEERRTELIEQRAEAEEAIGRSRRSSPTQRQAFGVARVPSRDRHPREVQADVPGAEQAAGGTRHAGAAARGGLRSHRAPQEGSDAQPRVRPASDLVEDELEELSQDEDSRFGEIRRYFADIVAAVISEQAILSMTVNKSGGVDFHAELMGTSGVATSGDKGTSYRKLLCIAFDLAILRAYLDTSFPRFVYLDGALEQLEPRKRENLIEVFRDYAGAGVQPIISLLDSDLPAPLGEVPRTLSPDDVVLTLHDEGEDGRLFKMPAW